MTMDPFDVLGHLLKRRSHPAATLATPAPDGAALNAMLEAASRVPDHGKLVPWRFILLRGDARDALGAKLVETLEARGESLDDTRREQETTRFSRAPLVIAVVSRATVHPKIPVWEQQLCVGAVCMNLVHAAHASGYAAQWLTEWMAFDDEVSAMLGLAEAERIAGFVHVGTPTQVPAERARPDLDSLISEWTPQ
ncbi:nitroreductase family protein [Stappia stellulata]|uniref:nitroreductase family protein n=1 Tax=Stappia stellulata TaxID=71235 RepID=UPI0012EC5784|nr:nitroreductase [Stappia stellulata]